MNVQDWAAFFVAIFTLIGGLAAGVRWMVKHYLSELKPNSGTSLKDAVNRLEIRVDEIMTILMTQNVKPRKKATPQLTLNQCNCNKSE
jgi:H+/Cl- antiporter ClcA